MSTEGVHHMTRTQAGVNMVPRAGRQGMLGPNRGYITAKPTKPKPRAPMPNQQEFQHHLSQNPGTPRTIKIAPSRKKSSPRRRRHPV
ncbi:MAG: hypothetical protein DI631_07190, partial [Acinetobacter johnsonii]